MNCTGRRNWSKSKVQVKEKWGELTVDDLTAVNGKREQLEGKIQERYGIARDRRADVDDWYAKRPGSRSWCPPVPTRHNIIQRPVRLDEALHALCSAEPSRWRSARHQSGRGGRQRAFRREDDRIATCPTICSAGRLAGLERQTTTHRGQRRQERYFPREGIVESADKGLHSRSAKRLNVRLRCCNGR